MQVRVGLAGWREIGVEEKTRMCLENAVEKSGIVGVYCPTDTNIWFNPIDSQLIAYRSQCWQSSHVGG